MPCHFALHARCLSLRQAAIRLLALLSLAASLAPMICTPPTYAQPGDSQPVSVDAVLPTDKVYVGDAFNLSVQVKGARTATVENFPAIPETQVAYDNLLDQSITSTIIINGRVTTSSSTACSLIYRLRRDRPGTLTIPPIDVTIDGKTYRTRSVSIDIHEPTQSKDIRLELTSDASLAYVGQPVQLQLKWTISRDVRNYQFSFPDIEGADILPGPSLVNSPGSPAIELVVRGERMHARVERQTMLGSPVIIYTIDRVLIPTRPGRLYIPAVRGDFDVVVGKRQRTIFDDPFSEALILERQAAVSTPVTIDVNELPAQGRPRNFSGLVGQYSIDAALSQTEASVGDPIPLTIRVNGPHPLSRVPAMDLALQPIAKTFRIPRDPLLADISSGSAVFEATVRPRSSDVKVLPPLELNYFDPVAGAYKVAASKPVSINIRASTNVTLPDDPAAELSQEPPVVSEAQSRMHPSALPIPRRYIPRLFRGEVFTASNWRSLLICAASLLAPIVSALLLLAVRALNARDPVSRARRAAYRDARRSLSRIVRKGTLTPDVLARTVRSYIARCVPDAPAELTSEQAVAHAKNTIPDARSAIVSTLSTTLCELDAARFAASPTPRINEQFPARARSLIDSLHISWAKAGEK